MRRQPIVFSALVFITGSAACAHGGADPGGQSLVTDRGEVAPEAVRMAVRDLITADEAFSTAASAVDLATGISAMFAPDVAMPVPGARFTKTREEAIAALRSAPGSADSHASWAVAYAGVSADGIHGFTAGYMRVNGAPGTKQTPFKYLAYWIKRPEGWRVAVYRRRPGTLLDEFRKTYAPLPARFVSSTTDARAIDRFRESLDNAERSFSNDAQKTGLQAAFVKWGTAASWNMGPPTEPTFTVGAEKIGISVGGGEPKDASSVYWAPDRVIVASSGDLGVTIGTIHLHKPAADGSQDAGFAFFTVWHRPNPTEPWRYIAE